MSFSNFAQSGFYGWEYGGVYLDGVVVTAGYGYCLAFPFEACGGVHDCVVSIRRRLTLCGVGGL